MQTLAVVRGGHYRVLGNNHSCCKHHFLTTVSGCAPHTDSGPQVLYGHSEDDPDRRSSREWACLARRGPAGEGCPPWNCGSKLSSQLPREAQDHPSLHSQCVKLSAPGPEGCDE